MVAAPTRSDRWTAVILLSTAAIFPAGILGLYFFAHEPVDWRHALEVAMAPENRARMQFILLGIGAVLSGTAAATTTFARHRLILRVLFFSASALTLCYVFTGMWLLAFVSALPLWWFYKVAG
jgi:Kef-type K+ transport system membrane component KefB